MTTCSWCSAPATFMGEGQDGDLYCDQHVGKAEMGVTPLDPEIPPLRTIDGDSMTLSILREYKQNGWRVYDAACPYRLSHTKYLCHYDNCPEE